MHSLLTDIVTLYMLIEIMRIMISNEKVFSSNLSNNDYLNRTQYRNCRITVRMKCGDYRNFRSNFLTKIS